MFAAPTLWVIAALCLASFIAPSCFADADPVRWSAALSPPGIRAGEGGQIIVKAVIEPGWHIYSLNQAKGGPKPTTIELSDGSALQAAGDPVQPEVKTVHDAAVGADVEEFEKSVSFGLGAVISDGAKGPQKASLKVTYQACNKTACLLPKTVSVPLEFTPEAGPPREDHRDAIGTPPVQDNPVLTTPPALADTDQNAGGVDRAKRKGLLLFMAYCFGGGLLSLLTPCVFPMIPLTVNFFTKRQAATRKAGVRDAIAYCVGIIGTFTFIGLAVTIVFGAGKLQQLATNPYLNIAFALLFIALAANLLGMFEIVIPQAVQQKAQSGPRQGGVMGPVFMGVASTISSFTCTGAIVGSLLATAATGDKLYPILGMLSFSTAFAMPFFLLALFPQYLSRMPKSGSWMVSVKAYMGFLELAAAVKFLSNADLVWSTGILTRPVFLGCWAAVMLAAGLYMIGLLPLKGHDRSRIGPTRRGIGVVSFAIAGYCIAGARGMPLGAVEAFLPPEKSTWIQNFETAKAEAKRTNRPIFINFTGVTCTNCRSMEKNMFTRDDVRESLKGYVLVELYTDRTGKYKANDEANQVLEQKLTQTLTLPVYVVTTPDGDARSNFQGSTTDAAKFISFLKQGKPEALAGR
jgi:thiol:disulfide interchange protein DsbD